MSTRLHDGSQIWDPLNLIFPAYFELMTRFSTVHLEDVTPAEFAGRFPEGKNDGLPYCGWSKNRGQVNTDFL